MRPPGRESRVGETPYTEMEALVAAAVDALLPLLDRPFALFGHCSGDLVAFEFARLRRARPDHARCICTRRARRADGLEFLECG
ncbi:MAG TPA: hypothetical protein DEV93_14730 [Chloroflexi bacterium]|nr:hypothetical protein [Chloroflexota bacterium]